MNVLHSVDAWVEKQPSAPALIEVRQGRQIVTSRQALQAEARRMAALLSGRGIKAGDAVLVLVPISRRLYVTLLALAQLGAPAVFVDPAAGRAHIARCCQMLPPAAVIAGWKGALLALANPALRAAPIRLVDGLPPPGWASLARVSRCQPLAHVADLGPDHPALITFTSGSTGLPKAAVRSHAFLSAQRDALVTALDFTPGQVDLSTLPIFVLMNLASGISSVLPGFDVRRPARIDAAAWAQHISLAGVQRLVTSPAALERLASYAPAADARLATLKQVYVGGGPVFPRLMQAAQQAAPAARITAVYGSTEAEPIAHIDLQDISEQDREAMRQGAGLPAGRPVSVVAVRIIADRWGEPLGPLSAAAFDALEAAPGQTGEILVSGDHVLRGYLNGQGDAETKVHVEDQVWHRTGDAGRIDADGRLWLSGRCAARLADARGVIYPFSVECAISEQYPQVMRSALVGWQGRRVLLIEGQSVDLAAIMEGLAWAGLDAVYSVKALPVDARHNSKIDYPRLMKLVAHLEAQR